MDTNEDSENESKYETNMLILTHGTIISKTRVFTSVDSVVPTKPDLEDFWNIEAIGVTDLVNESNDEIAVKNFKETVKFENGMYQVTWPWKEESPDLPPNRELAISRLKQNVARMTNKPDVLKKYNEVIQEQLSKGVIEKVDQKDKDGLLHYIPHHAVITPQKATTKLRIVYDASAKTKLENKSLNECLYRGSVMLRDLSGLLMRFRLYKVALVTDIEKAFLQIGLQQSERDVTRFLWLKDCDKPYIGRENIQEYRFCRVPFGIISSPFLLGATIENHLDHYQNDIALKIKDDIYVDNIITGTDSMLEATELYSVSRNIFKDASMNMRQWASNNTEVAAFIPEEDKDVNETIKVLGH